MSDIIQLATILAVAAVAFFSLGCWYASGRKGVHAAESDNPGRDEAQSNVWRRDLAAAEAQLATAQETITALEADLGAAREKLASASSSGGAASPTLGTESDPELGAVYSVRPETVDDLKAIRGIGKSLARQLNDLGIYKLAQIAAWEKGQVEAFSKRLAFKDRIQRDDWVGQAKRLSGP